MMTCRCCSQMGTAHSRRSSVSRWVTAPYAVTTGDFNGDGLHRPGHGQPQFSDDVSVLLGNGDGTFADQQQITLVHVPLSITTGDFNGDGAMDLATANGSSSDVSVLLGVGDGTFAIGDTIGIGAYPDAITIGDTNGDGIDDLITANRFSYDVLVLLGNGDGTFAVGQSFLDCDVSSVCHCR